MRRRHCLLLAGAAPFALMSATSRATSPTAPPGFTLWAGGYAPHATGLQAFAFGPPRQGDSAPTVQVLGHESHADSPSFLCSDPGLPGHLYALHEATHQLSHYVQTQPGRLQHRATVASGGRGPVHLSLHPQAPLAFVAHYGSAEVALFQRDAQGGLRHLRSQLSFGVPGDAEASAADARPGPPRAERAPPGSFAYSGHDAPHVHMAQADPSGRWLMATDLGRDRLARWPLAVDASAPEALLGLRQDLALSPGGGPRHFVFHPRDPSQLYVLMEESSTLAWLRWNAATGELQRREEISALPPGFAGTSFASDLLCCPEGRYLYALNRLHDSIAVFALGPDGAPRLLDTVWTRGSYPRNALLSPDGRWLIVANQRSDHLTVFERLPRDGALRFTGLYLAAASPASLAALAGS